MNHNAHATYPRTVRGSDGHVMVFLYNRQIENSGLVSNTGVSTANHTPMASTFFPSLNWNGGPVQTNPKIYVDLWGSSTQWGAGDVDGVANYYTAFINGVGGSQWLSSVTQYGEPNAPYTGNQTGSYVGTWNDTANAVPRLTGGNYQNLIGAEAARAAAHFGDYSSNASYVILLPHGVAVNGFGTSYCAWHSTTKANKTLISYTTLPYIPDAGSNCGAGTVNTPGTDDGVSIVGGMEQAETETDPQPNTGWLDGGNNENGSKCAWQNLTNTTFATGTFPTQGLWSNAALGCV